MTEWERRTAPILAFLSLLFIVVWSWPIIDPSLPAGWRAVCHISSGLLWIAFAVDLGIRWRQARHQNTWARRHVFDVITVIIPLLRPLRFLRYVLQVGTIRGSAVDNPGGRVAIYTVASTILAAFVGSVTVLSVERGAPGGTIETFGEALWWSCVTMATVGYGDYIPVTTEGRFVAVGLMFGGILITGAVAGAITSWVTSAVRARTNQRLGDRIESEVDDMQRAVSTSAANHATELSLLREELAALRAAVEGRTPRDPD